jgi:hypothetical protein
MVRGLLSAAGLPPRAATLAHATVWGSAQVALLRHAFITAALDAGVLSMRGNRRLNHAIHMAAITQIRYQHSDGRGYYDRKKAEGKTGKEALRALKRQISDAIYQRLKADAARAAASSAQGPGGQPGNDSVASAAGSHPERQLFGQATPGPAPTLRPPVHQRKRPTSHGRRKTARTT